MKNFLLRLYKCCSFGLLLVIFCSCSSTAGYKKPVTDFRNASSVVIETARIYVTQLNKIQRDAYIDRQVVAAKQIKLSEIEKEELLSQKEINIRLRALNELSKYGELLVQLTSSDAPERVTSNAEDLSKSLDKLQGNLDSLNTDSSAGFKGAFGPVAKLIGEVTRLAVEQKIQQALDRAILGGEKPIQSLINTIRDDIVTAFELKRTTLSDARTIYIDGYERERERKRGYSILRERGQEIKLALDIWEAFPASDPRESLDAMAAAHGALLDYSKSPKKSGDLAAFTAQMELFVARAKRVGNAVRQLQQLQDN